MSTQTPIYGRRFNAAIHQESDPKGKTATIELLGQMFKAHYLSENNEDGGRPRSGQYFDLSFRFPNTGRVAKVEVEYTFDNYRFRPDHPDCHVVYRKHKNACDLFVTIGDDYAWICPAEKVKSCPVRTRPVRGGRIDSFFACPWDLGPYFVNKNGLWEKTVRPVYKPKGLDFDSLEMDMRTT